MAEAVPIAEVMGHEMLLHGVGQPEVELEEEDVVEFDLEEEQAEVKPLAMVRFYSRKKFNVRGLFEEMSGAWGLQSMKQLQVLGDNKFLLEFDSEEIKQRVVEGGPWRHKGDALIVVSYDGSLSHPSTIVMNTIALSARFYDLPTVLRKDYNRYNSNNSCSKYNNSNSCSRYNSNRHYNRYNNNRCDNRRNNN
jgi:hypothetical protein